VGNERRLIRSEWSIAYLHGDYVVLERHIWQGGSEDPTWMPLATCSGDTDAESVVRALRATERQRVAAEGQPAAHTSPGQVVDL
jgi:hypothetical protein